MAEGSGDENEKEESTTPPPPPDPAPLPALKKAYYRPVICVEVMDFSELFSIICFDELTKS